MRGPNNFMRRGRTVNDFVGMRTASRRTPLEHAEHILRLTSAMVLSAKRANSTHFRDLESARAWLLIERRLRAPQRRQVSDSANAELARNNPEEVARLRMLREIVQLENHLHRLLRRAVKT